MLLRHCQPPYVLETGSDSLGQRCVVPCLLSLAALQFTVELIEAELGPSRQLLQCHDAEVFFLHILRAGVA